MTPSAVSHRIKALEDRLQAPLFERRTRELALTRAGVDLLAQVEPLLRELDDVTRRFMQRTTARVVAVSPHLRTLEARAHEATTC